MPPPDHLEPAQRIRLQRGELYVVATPHETMDNALVITERSKVPRDHQKPHRNVLFETAQPRGRRAKTRRFFP